MGHYLRKPAGKPSDCAESPRLSGHPFTSTDSCGRPADPPDTRQCCGGTSQEPCGPLNWWQQNPKCLPQNGNQQTPINFDINEEGYSGMGKGAGLIFEAGKCAGEVKPKDGVWEVEFFDCSEPFFVTAKGACVRACGGCGQVGPKATGVLM